MTDPGIRLRWALAIIGVTLLGLGVILLTTWEVALFRLTTFDRDFTGLTCGTPLDNPGWSTGSPCHGAVNRQTGAAWLLTLNGAASLVAAGGLAVGHHRRRRPTTAAPVSAAHSSPVRFVGSWRQGLGIDHRAGWAPLAAVPLGTLGVVVNSIRDEGDIRVGLLPWTVLIAVLAFAACSLGLLNEHGPTPTRWTMIGAWWTTIALLGIGGFFAAIGIGGLLGIDEEEAGVAALIPVLLMAFGLLSMTPALATLGIGVTKARELRWWGRLAIWTAAPVLPLLLIFGGLVDGTAETIGSAALIASFGVSWVALGLALTRLDEGAGIDNPGMAQSQRDAE